MSAITWIQTLIVPLEQIYNLVDDAVKWPLHEAELKLNRRDEQGREM